MRKMQQFSVLLLAAGLILGFAGCPAEDKHQVEKGGSLTVTNTTSDVYE